MGAAADVIGACGLAGPPAVAFSDLLADVGRRVRDYLCDARDYQAFLSVFSDLEVVIAVGQQIFDDFIVDLEVADLNTVVSGV